jgi:hypothetical protein
MVKEPGPDYLPISHLNAYAYCPRRFYYEFVLAEMVVNEHVLEGQQLHERVDQPGSNARGEKEQLRHLYLCAPKLGVIGYCDLVEIEGEKTKLVEVALGPCPALCTSSGIRGSARTASREHSSRLYLLYWFVPARPGSD